MLIGNLLTPCDKYKLFTIYSILGLMVKKYKKNYSDKYDLRPMTLNINTTDTNWRTKGVLNRVKMVFEMM